MTREDAVFEKILLQSGFTETYDAWLDHYLEIEDPLSDIVLDLIDCRSNLDKTISCLHFYSLEKPYDHAAVMEKLRLYLKNAYENSALNQDACIAAMYRFAVNSKRMHEEFYPMMVISDYYELTEEKFIDKKQFDTQLFFPYLKEGKMCSSEELRSLWYQKPPTLWQKLKEKFKR